MNGIYNTSTFTYNGKVILNLLKVIIPMVLLLSLSILPSFGQQESLGIFQGQTDIGKVLNPGSVTYNPEEQVYTIEGSGTNMWFDQDEFHFVWKRVKGNFILHTNAQFIGNGIEAHRKLGWIVRSGLESNSKHKNR